MMPHSRAVVARRLQNCLPPRNTGRHRMAMHDTRCNSSPTMQNVSRRDIVLMGLIVSGTGVESQELTTDKNHRTLHISDADKEDKDEAGKNRNGSQGSERSSDEKHIRSILGLENTLRTRSMVDSMWQSLE